MSKLLPTVIRHYQEVDHSYIMDTWLREYREAMPWCFIPYQLFYAHQPKLIDQLLQKANVLVSCLADDPETIVGYVVYEEQAGILVIHWGHVKLRGKQIFSELLECAGHPHWRQEALICTQVGRSFLSLKKKYKLNYDPYLLQRITYDY